MKIRPGAILLRHGELLVLRYRYGGKERLNLPGGNLEPGETLSAGLARELAEELAIFAGEQFHLALLAETRIQGTTTLHPLFFLPHWQGEPVLQPGETHAEGLSWLPPAAWAEAPLYPAVGAMLATWAEKQTGLGYVGCLDQPWMA